MNESTDVRYDMAAGMSFARSAFRHKMSMSFYAGQIERYIRARATGASDVQEQRNSLIRRSILTDEDLKLLDAKMLRTHVGEKPAPKARVVHLSGRGPASRFTAA